MNTDIEADSLSAVTSDSDTTKITLYTDEKNVFINLSKKEMLVLVQKFKDLLSNDHDTNMIIDKKSIDFSFLKWKTIAKVQLMKKGGFDDVAWLRLEFDDGTYCFLESTYGNYTGESVDEYPTFIEIKKDVSYLDIVREY